MESSDDITLDKKVKISDTYSKRLIATLPNTLGN